ncbi:MAG: 5-bromo-4-chloroindolyl phosphate hydrolysis family protein [Rhizomicrobium sp.]
MGRGTSIFLAGAGAAIALPVCVFALGLPLWLGAGIAAGVFFGVSLAVRPSGIGLNMDALEEAQSDTTRVLITDGSAALARLERTIPAIKDTSMNSAVKGLSTTAEKILANVKTDPVRVMAIRRFLTFYLPNAASIAEGWQTLERNGSLSPERVAQARDVMGALGDAFKKFASDADAPELQELDLNLKVVKDSLKADLEKAA